MTSTTKDEVSFITTPRMSGAELKVQLSGLGLPPGWFADEMSVTMRTVVRWFDSDTVSPEVASEVEKLSERTVEEMLAMVAAVDDSDNPVILKTYRTDAEFASAWPASWHRQLTFRVVEHFQALGREVSVEYH